MFAQRAQGQPLAREVLSPSEQAPARLSPGDVFSVDLRVASGLTPPPGRQQVRALAGFELSLCAEGWSLGAAPRTCFALAPREVRPLDSRTLVYRVQARLPRWVAPSVYDLRIRFPGAKVQLHRAVRVGDADCADALHPPNLADDGPDQARCLRVHLGPMGLRRASSWRARYFPLPRPNGHFADGCVALVTLGGRPPSDLAVGRGWTGDLPVLAPVRAVAGEPTPLRVEGELSGFQVFFRVDEFRGALGASAEASFLPGEHQPVEAAVIGPNGAAIVLRAPVSVEPRVEAGCSLESSTARATRGLGAGIGVGLGLLAAAFSRKLARPGRWK